MNIKTPVNKEDLVKAMAAGSHFEYLLFWGHRRPKNGDITKSCFSQWYDSPFVIEDEGFLTAEHYMMVRKARLFDDAGCVAQIFAASTPKDAKALGRKVKNYSEPVWLSHREEIVFTGNLAKFSQNVGLRAFLLATENQVLVAANPVDAIWGIGLAADDPRAKNPLEWPGLNLLGFALNNVREKLKSHS